MEDCKRNSGLLLAQCIHNLEKEFEKAGLANHSFELRQKLENCLEETFNQIEGKLSAKNIILFLIRHYYV